MHSLVPRLPDLFNVAREKEGEPGKTYHVRDVRWTDFHIWHNSKLAGLRHGFLTESSGSFDVNVTIGFESENGGSSVPSLRVESCDLHDNSIHR